MSTTPSPPTQFSHAHCHIERNNNGFRSSAQFPPEPPVSARPEMMKSTQCPPVPPSHPFQNLSMTNFPCNAEKAISSGCCGSVPNPTKKLFQPSEPEMPPFSTRQPPGNPFFNTGEHKAPQNPFISGPVNNPFSALDTGSAVSQNPFAEIDLARLPHPNPFSNQYGNQNPPPRASTGNLLFPQTPPNLSGNPTSSNPGIMLAHPDRFLPPQTEKMAERNFDPVRSRQEQPSMTPSLGSITQPQVQMGQHQPQMGQSQAPPRQMGQSQSSIGQPPASLSSFFPPTPPNLPSSRESMFSMAPPSWKIRDAAPKYPDLPPPNSLMPRRPVVNRPPKPASPGKPSNNLVNFYSDSRKNGRINAQQDEIEDLMDPAKTVLVGIFTAEMKNALGPEYLKGVKPLFRIMIENGNISIIQVLMLFKENWGPVFEKVPNCSANTLKDLGNF